MEFGEKMLMVNSCLIKAIAVMPREQVFAWREIHEIVDDQELKIDWSKLHRWTPEHRDAASAALYDISIGHDDAASLMKVMFNVDQRLCSWLACALARTTFGLMPVNKNRQRLVFVIETVERWVRGEVSWIKCDSARYQISNLAGTDADVAKSAARTTLQGGWLIDAQHEACNVVAYTAYAAALPWLTSRRWDRVSRKAYKDLCQTIALHVREAIEAASCGYSMEELRSDSMHSRGLRR